MAVAASRQDARCSSRDADDTRWNQNIHSNELVNQVRSGLETGLLIMLPIEGALALHPSRVLYEPNRYIAKLNHCLAFVWFRVQERSIHAQHHACSLDGSEYRSNLDDAHIQ